MTDATDSFPLLAVSPRVPEIIRSRVPEAMRGIWSERVPEVPASTVLLVVAHRGPCELLEAANAAGLTCLQFFDPTGSVQPEDDPVDDVIYLGASRDEIVWRAARALARRDHGATSEAVEAPVVGDDGVSWGDRFVPLSASELRLARRLLDGRAALVSRKELSELVGRHAPDGRALEAHLYRLRRKLREIPVLQFETVRQRGYRLRVVTSDE